tara:strand:+ start:212 stop:415 length:204 start_codon:yes stop_codon:yes gene_type:complete
MDIFRDYHNTPAITIKTTLPAAEYIHMNNLWGFKCPFNDYLKTFVPESKRLHAKIGGPTPTDPIVNT